MRQEECLDLLLALNSGVPGLATVHANSARHAVAKLCTLPLLAAENVTSAFVVPTVAATIDLEPCGECATSATSCESNTPKRPARSTPTAPMVAQTRQSR